MRRLSAFVLFLVAFVFVTVAAAQVKTVNGGVLNGKATSLPKPAYPEAAKSVGAEGAISVQIEIDVNGNVISAQAEPMYASVRQNADGSKAEPVAADSSLMAAAEAAALGAKFSPTVLSGQPIHVKGTIVYNFVSGKSDTFVRSEVKSVTPETAGQMSSGVKTVSGGVLNGKASSLPAPAYPPAAMAVNASGAVSVQVMIDEGGNVISAAAVSGHPLLKSAAEAAAREAKFSQTILNGTAVSVSGVITYNFVPGKEKKVDQ